MNIHTQNKVWDFENRFWLLGIFVAGLALLIQLFVVPLAHGAPADPKLESEIRSTLAELPEEVRGANQVLKTAKGVLVFPNVYEAGFVFGGEYGKGGLLVNNRIIDYYRLIAGSFGWQIGGQKKAIVIAFMTNEAFQNFRTGSGWDIGADANVTLVTEGIEGEISAGRLDKPIFAFVVDQKGLMAGATLKGLKVTKL